jgi:hypothetical protein
MDDVVIIGEVTVFLFALTVTCDDHVGNVSRVGGFDSTMPNEGNDKRHATLTLTHGIGDPQKT